MKKKIKVAIIDSGINYKTNLFQLVSEGLCIQYDNEYMIYNMNYNDFNGHGTYCAEIIRRFCPEVEFVIIKILNEQKKGSAQSLIEALRYLESHRVDIVNMSLATQNLEYVIDLQKICNKLVEDGVILVSSLANHYDNSYPAVFKSVIGVKGRMGLSEKEYIYQQKETIQCQGSNIPVLVNDLDGTYTFFGGNSKATANFVGIIASMISNVEYDCLAELENQLVSNSLNINDSRDEGNFQIDIYKKNSISSELLNDSDFYRLYEIIQDSFNIPKSRSKLIMRYSLLNPVFEVDKKVYGELIKAIEKEWGIFFHQEMVTLSAFQSIENLYGLLKGILKNEFDKK